MKKSIILTTAILLFGAATTASAQTDNARMMPIAVSVPSNVRYESVRSVLETSLATAATRGGMSGDLASSRFVMFPSVTSVDTRRTTTPPVMTMVELQVTVYIADYVDKKIYASTNLTVKGGGQSEEKAWLDAAKHVGTNTKLDALVADGRKRILDYYNSMCDKLIAEANSLATRQRYADAAEVLASVPQAAECYERVQAGLADIFRQYYATRCTMDLQQARAMFAGHNIDGALGQLAMIYPGCPCYDEADALYRDVKAYIDQQAERDYSDAKAERAENRKEMYEEKKLAYELAMKTLELELEVYRDERNAERKMADRAYELARIQAKNTTTIQTYVNSF